MFFETQPKMKGSLQGGAIICLFIISRHIYHVVFDHVHEAQPPNKDFCKAILAIYA